MLHQIEGKDEDCQILEGGGGDLGSLLPHKSICLLGCVSLVLDEVAQNQSGAPSPSSFTMHVGLSAVLRIFCRSSCHYQQPFRPPPLGALALPSVCRLCGVSFYRPIVSFPLATFCACIVVIWLADCSQSNHQMSKYRADPTRSSSL